MPKYKSKISKETFSKDAELLKYDFTIVNKQSNLRTNVKNATMTTVKKLLEGMQKTLRENLKDGEFIPGRTSFSNRVISDEPIL